jgi:hypothetical protein
MIANSFNVLLGLALVYASVLQPALTASRPGLLVAAGASIFVAALLGRRNDHHPWQNSTNMGLALLLAAVGALRLEHLPLTMFWSQFSIGTVVAVLALWATLYRPTTPQV